MNGYGATHGPYCQSSGRSTRRADGRATHRRRDHRMVIPLPPALLPLRPYPSTGVQSHPHASPTPGHTVTAVSTPHTRIYTRTQYPPSHPATPHIVHPTAKNARKSKKKDQSANCPAACSPTGVVHANRPLDCSPIGLDFGISAILEICAGEMCIDARDGMGLVGSCRVRWLGHVNCCSRVIR